MNFERDGVQLIRGCLDKDLVALVRLELLDWFAGGMERTQLQVDGRRESHSIDRVFNLNSELPTIERLWAESSIKEVAAALLGVDSVGIFYTQTIMKYPALGTSGTIGWHSDFAYWGGASHPNLITAWIPFQRVDESGGAVHYLKGSHRDSESAEKAMFKSEYLVGAESAFIGACSVGDVLFHHCLTVHGSPSSRSREGRLALAVHLADEDIVPVNVSRCHHSLKWLETAIHKP